MRTRGIRAVRSTARPSLVAAALCALLAPLAGCGMGAAASDASGRTTLTFTNWAAAEGTTRPALLALIDDFERRNPDIEVKVEAVPFTDIGNRLLLQQRAGNPPDVAEVSGTDTLNLAEAGALAPLEPLAGPRYVRQLIPEVAELGRYDGKLVAVPWTVAPFGLWYNKKLLRSSGLDPARPPRTLAELDHATRVVKARHPNVIPLGLDTTNRPFGLDHAWAWLATHGAEPLRDGRVPAAFQRHFTDYLRWLRAQRQAGTISPNQTIGYFRPLAAQDKVAFTWDGPYLKGVIQDANGMSDEEFHDTWGVTTLPAGPAGSRASVPTDHQLVVFGDSDEKRAAWRLVRFLTTAERAVTDFTVGAQSSLSPQRTPPKGAARTLAQPAFAAFRERIVPDLVRPAWGLTYLRVYQPVMTGIQRAVTSDDDLDAIAAEVADEIRNEL